jgi:uncharacterized membrane protein
MGKPVKSIWGRIRRAFLAGLFVGVPIAVSVWVLVLVVGFLESAVNLLPIPLRPETYLGKNVPGTGLVLTVTTIFLLGFLAESYVGRWLLWSYETAVSVVPGISAVYSGAKQLMQQLTQSDRKGFESVVLVQWPRKGLYAVAFMTGESFVKTDNGPMVNLFMPTTPNPTTGFFIVIPERDVVHTQMTVEEAFKLLMSAGIVAPPSPLTVPAKHMSAFANGDFQLADLGDPQDTE